jgi:hypothetical protein
MNLKILHITDFHYRHNSRLFYSTARKISNGFIKNNYYVSEISERDSFNKNLLGLSKLDITIINNVLNLNPDLIVIGHCSKINYKTFEQIKLINKNIKIIQWFVDSLTKVGPDYNHNLKTFYKYFKFIDHSFISTDIQTIQINKRDKKKVSYFPNPCDESIDNLKIDKILNPIYDLFFAMSHGQHRGVLKKYYKDNREDFVNQLIPKIPNIICDFYGFNNINPIWADNYFTRLTQSKMALNLSRGKSVKYYSSDRISSLVPNGITTFIDIKTNLNNFFNDNEVVFYKNINDLGESINYLKVNDKKRREIGHNGRIKYHKNFNNKLVTNFMIEKALNLKFSKNYQWI